MKKIPKPFGVRKLGPMLLPSGERQSGYYWYELNALPGIVAPEINTDHETLEFRATCNNAIFKAGVEWAIKHMSKARKR